MPFLGKWAKCRAFLLLRPGDKICVQLSDFGIRVEARIPDRDLSH